MTRMVRLWWVNALVLAMVGPLCAVVRASTVTVAPPPSGSASFAITLANTGSASVAQPRFHLAFFPSSPYSITAAAPCHIHNLALTIIPSLEAPPLAAGESVSCTVTFARTSVTPISSFAIHPSPAPGSATVTLAPSRWEFGVFDDPSISVGPVHPLPMAGATEALFRITVTNPGDFPLTDVEAGGCQFVSSAMVTMDTHIPGGCAGSSLPYVFCFTGLVDFSAPIPDVPAHSQQSCLVRARRSSGLVEGTGWPFDLYFLRDAETASGYRVGDSNWMNNSTYADVAFGAPAQAIPAGRAQLFALLALVIFASALVGLHRAKQASTFSRSHWGSACGGASWQ
ncbi:MAG: hypothetical protein IPG63_19560 [Xanthomonadales bacterium]|nr:hypothetical protein [Xanthomonadales bacterium]MBK7146238.1 hypothetical protein [Xanthomonadales bacterium]MCC6562565.1 hypothetical protein [Xanthomonadales bacterium]